MSARSVGVNGRLAVLGLALLALLVSVAALRPAPALAEFGIAAFDGQVNAGPDPDPLPNPGEPGDPANFAPAYTQAGGHPFSVTTTIRYNTTPNFFEKPTIDGGQFRNVVVDLPPGFVGNPDATPKCREDQLAASADKGCPLAAAVGWVAVDQVFLEPGTLKLPVYNMVAPQGVAAQFAFNVGGVIVHMNASVRTGKDYGVTLTIADVNQGIIVNGSTMTLWGVPAAPAHDAQRGMCLNFGGECAAGIQQRAFITLPVDCSAGPLTTSLRTNSWADPSRFVTAQFVSHLPAAYPAPPGQWGAPQGVTGCENVPFEPRLSVEPTTQAADSPTGLEVELSIPQQGLDSGTGIAASSLKAATVELPEGMAVNPSSAAGLGTCSEAEIELTGPAPASCPASSKIGTVMIETPLLDHQLSGGVYLAKQGQNKFGSLLAIYLAARDPESGVVVKLPGKVATSASGRLTASFDENPQLPFETLAMSLFSGPRASLVTPPACGTYSTSATFTPWSGTASVATASGFKVTTGPDGKPCPDGGFSPSLQAGTTNPVAGSYSPFVLRLSRQDGSARLATVSATLPPGLLGKLKDIPYCSEAALASVPSGEGSAASQLATPSCPAASRIGSVTVGAGAGSSPFYVQTGSAYLAGPYKGAPLSLAFVTPALAGPFDLGNVVVRAALRVDPTSTQIAAVSDPLPLVLHGIPLDIREVAVNLNRGEFTLNPTSCEAMQVESSVGSASGQVSRLADRFQVADCERLALKPKLALRFSGAPTRRGGHPKLTATLTTGEDEANLKRVQVTLPKTEFLENAHIRTVCTRVQYAAKQCPAKSVYGYARAWTPLLDKPLEGPVYLRSSTHKLPDLVASLDGQIHVDLAGRIDSVKSRIRNTFETVPDAPVSKFVLTMQGGAKGLLVNNTNLCGAKPRATVRFVGQNGKTATANPVVRTGCRKPPRTR